MAEFLNNYLNLYIVGFIFCGIGLFLLFKNMFDDVKSIKNPIILIIMGVILISFATAKKLNLIQ